MERAIDEQGTGTTFKAISGETLRQLEVPIATLEHQDRAIAEIEMQFSRLDEAVAKLKRVKANLDRYLAATLGEAFSGTWAGTKADWPPVPLREAADVQLGQQRAPVHAADVNPIPYVRAANVTWQGLDLGDVKSMGFPNAARYRLAYGDILLAEASGSANEVGKPAIWRDEIPGACYQKTLIRVRCRPDLLNHEFAYYFFLHTALSGQFAKLAPGVGILHLTAERMLVWPMVVPPLPVQASVVAEADRRFSIVREVEAEVDANLKRAQALRQAVLWRAYHGANEAVPSMA
jgi:type I restriction enzyme S subunit